MKIEFVLDPVIQVKTLDDLDPKTYGCIGIQLRFILRPSLDATQQDIVDLTKGMMLASCNVINKTNEPVMEET